MASLNMFGDPSPVSFVHSRAVPAAKESISLKQGESVVLVVDDIAIKVSNNKFHSLVATNYVLVNFAEREADASTPDVHQVEPALVGTSIEWKGKTLARVLAVESKSKLLTIDIADGVTVRSSK